MPRRPSSPFLRAALVAGGVATIFAFAGCTATAPEPPVTATATSTSTPTAAPTPTATGPVFHPDGTAEDNLPLFRSVVEAVWATPSQVEGRAYIDALVTAGFDKSAMQLTPDQSTVGNPAESIQFSVRWGDDCLVGQVGPATGDPFATVVPGLEAGGCLIGRTRPIDW